MLSAGCFCAPPEYNPAARGMLFSVFQSASSFFGNIIPRKRKKTQIRLPILAQNPSVRARFASAVYAFSL